MSLPWDEPSWLDRATSWIDGQVERTGEVELERTRPWAAVARVPTPEGVLAPIGRARVWQRTLVGVERDPSAEFGEPVAAWLEIQHGIADGAIRLGGA